MVDRITRGLPDNSWQTRTIGELVERVRGLENLSNARIENVESMIFAMDRRWGDLAKQQDVAMTALSVANQKATDVAFTASNAAVAKAESYNDEWKRNHNEWASKFEHQSSTMATRADLEQRMAFVTDKFDSLGRNFEEKLLGITKSIEPIRAMGDMRSGRDTGMAERDKIWIALGTLFVAALAVLLYHVVMK